MSHIQFEFERLYDLVREKEKERDDIKLELINSQKVIFDMDTEKEKMSEEIKYLKHQNYVTNQLMEDIKIVNRNMYSYYTKLKNENDELQQKINCLTDCSIRYKRSIDPDNLENYTYEGRNYLRDILTDAVYNKKGKLIGYIDNGMLVKI
jgi:hypothetical protein